MSFFGQEFDFDLGAVNWNILGYTSASSTLADLTAEVRKLPLKAFCGNKHCDSWKWAKVGYYYVPKLGVSVEVRAKRDQVNCPHCTHALFWSRKHRLMGDGWEVINQDNARREAGLSPLIDSENGLTCEKVPKNKKKSMAKIAEPIPTTTVPTPQDSRNIFAKLKYLLDRRRDCAVDNTR